MIAPTTETARPSVLLPSTPRRPPLHRPVMIAALLLTFYFACTLITVHGGYLSTDTGGKVATLDAMAERGDLRPDLGYWAESVDPDGSLYPMFRTLDVNGQWVNVTSMPMLYLALPLYRLGGYTLALLVPMLGGVAAAWAAGRIARQLHHDAASRRGMGTDTTTMLVVGLATPITVYALDLWEHTLGVALMMWAVSWILDLGDEPRLAPAIGAGLAFGAAATMRQEALVYGAVAGAVVCWMGVRRPSVRALLAPMVMALSTGLMMVGGVALEVAAMGSSLRTGRSAGTAANSGGRAMLRLHEAAVTLGSIHRLPVGFALVVVVVLITGFTLLAVNRSSIGAAVSQRRGAVLIGLVYLLLLAGFVGSGLSFVSGMLLATPLAGIGLTAGWRQTHTRLAWSLAVLPLPLVWFFQYTGGAGPQWGGRYILLTGTLLAVIGLVVLDGHRPIVRRALMMVSVAVTILGVVWLGQRSAGYASAAQALADRTEPVLVFADPHAVREAGPVVLQEQWFAAPTDDLRKEAAAALTALDVDSFGFVSYQSPPDPGDGEAARLAEDRRVSLARAFPGFEPRGVDRIAVLQGVEFEVVTFVRG